MDILSTNLTALVPEWLDSLLMVPFRIPQDPYVGIWTGSLGLAAACVLIGEVAAALLFIASGKRFTAMQDEVMHYHNLSVDAVHAGDKQAYLAANRLAHDEFGKSFFGQASIGLASILPVPFALSWMAGRFEGIDIYDIPFTDLHAGYVFVFLTSYIVLRLLFGRVKDRLPLFRTVAKIREAARARRGEAKHF